MKLRTALLLGLLAVAAIILLLAQTRDPLACALEGLRYSKGWRFEELVNFTDAKVFIAGNVSLATGELLTSITVWRGGSAENYLVYSNSSHSMIQIHGGWTTRPGGWRLEDTVFYRLLALARESPERRAHTSGDLRVVEFSGRCGDLCIKIFFELRSLAGSASTEPERYAGSLTLRGCIPQELRLAFEGAGASTHLSYRVVEYDVSVNARP